MSAQKHEFDINIGEIGATNRRVAPHRGVRRGGVWRVQPPSIGQVKIVAQ